MADLLVLINGLPGSGKSTLARDLAPALKSTLISKDALKEAIAATVPDVPFRAIGVAAARVMVELAAATPGTVLLESWWFRPRDLVFVEADLRRCGSPPTVEIWCDVPPETALGRYRERQRPALYEDALHIAASWPRWATEAEPLRIGPTIVARTDRPVDITALIGQIEAASPDRP